MCLFYMKIILLSCAAARFSPADWNIMNARASLYAPISEKLFRYSLAHNIPNANLREGIKSPSMAMARAKWIFILFYALRAD